MGNHSPRYYKDAVVLAEALRCYLVVTLVEAIETGDFEPDTYRRSQALEDAIRRFLQKPGNALLNDVRRVVVEGEAEQQEALRNRGKKVLAAFLRKHHLRVLNINPLTSLDAPLSDGPDSGLVIDLVADEENSPSDDDVARVEHVAMVRAALEDPELLTSRESFVLRHTFEIGEDLLTQPEMEAMLEVGKGTVRHILKCALFKLERRLRACHGSDFL